MNRLGGIICIGVVGAMVPLAFRGAVKAPGDAPVPVVPAPVAPVPAPVVPVPYPVPVPVSPRPIIVPIGPWRPRFEAVVAGRTGPDGTEIAADLPESQQQKNIASRGLGCCVFRSIDHAARYQNVPAFQHFPEWMVSKGIEGGGYPQKVDTLAKKIAADRGQPVPEYINAEGMDLDLLCAACASGRMPCITYSKSPTGRYGGQRIAHMVNIVAADQKANGGKGWWVVLDNNYIGENNYEWMTTDEFKKAYSPGWCVILLAPPPPMPPKN